MSFKGFTGMRTYEHVLQNDLRALERWMNDVDTRVAADTPGEAINFYQTLISGAGLDIYRQSNEPTVGAKAVLWIRIQGTALGDEVYLHVKGADDVWTWMSLGTAV
jgi:hypothetical protein